MRLDRHLQLHLSQDPPEPATLQQPQSQSQPQQGSEADGGLLFPPPLRIAYLLTLLPPLRIAY